MALVSFLPDGRSIEVDPASTLLEASLASGLPHAHACGGKGRCSTCRVAVLEGAAACDPPGEVERAMAEAISMPTGLRLACQTRVHGEGLVVRRLVLDEADVEITSRLANMGSPQAVGDERRVAILFADLRGFTAFSNSLPPYDVVHVLNRFHAAMGPIVEAHHGAIDNYTGDGFLALFGVTEPCRACHEAIVAGLEMLRAMDPFRDYVRAIHGRTLDLGLGLHHGTAVVGAIGMPGRRRVTAIGDAVNFASRIESANKELGTRFLVSPEVAAAVGDHARFRPQRPIEIKGRPGPHVLLEVVGG